MNHYPWRTDADLKSIATKDGPVAVSTVSKAELQAFAHWAVANGKDTEADIARLMRIDGFRGDDGLLIQYVKGFRFEPNPGEIRLRDGVWVDGNGIDVSEYASAAQVAALKAAQAYFNEHRKDEAAATMFMKAAKAIHDLVPLRAIPLETTDA